MTILIALLLAAGPAPDASGSFDLGRFAGCVGAELGRRRLAGVAETLEQRYDAAVAACPAEAQRLLQAMRAYYGSEAGAARFDSRMKRLRENTIRHLREDDPVPVPVPG
ncbi:MAG TPA: hypothetical protein VFZ91_00130 [Allosphingosinicella sp.]